MINVGYITSYFGLKGEVKVSSNINIPEKVFKVNNSIYIDGKKYIIKTYRFHKNHYLLSFEGYEDINKINHLLKKDVYINRDEILSKDEYLNIELLGFDIIDNNNTIGKVEELLYNKNNFFIKCKNLIIPMIPKYLEKVDMDKKIIYVKESSELVI